jgi:transcriptional regulator with XRE-family HTH domain
MSTQIQTLLSTIIMTARSQGLTQAALAKAVGMSAVGLSKAKGRGDIRASHLAALAEQVDLELTLAPRRSQEKAVAAIRAGSFFASSDTVRSED